MLRKLSFHKFPKDENKCALWLTALKKNNPGGTVWMPTKNSVLCGAHFISGKPSNNSKHPDYAPSMFAHTSTATTQGQMDQKPHVFSNSKMRHMPICESTAITCSTSIKKAKLSPRALFPNDENIEPIVIYTAERLAPEQILTPPTGLRKTVYVAEREKLYLEIDNLRKEKEYLTKTNNDILEQLQQTRLSATAVDYNKSKCKFYTGVSYVFMTIFTFLSQFMIRTSLSDKFPLRDQLFITLVKLRLDFPFGFIAL